MFCKRQRQTGSNMATNVCITETQLREQVENAKMIFTMIACSRGDGGGPVNLARVRAGAALQDRTRDPLITNQVLYQLS